MKILVPYDFTPITKNALDHALALSTPLDARIELFHVVAKESQVAQALKKMEEVTAELPEAERAKVTCSVKPGNILRAIPAAAEDGGFRLLVMGTHGAVGLQKVLGSKAMKVITGSNTPFVVTQSKAPRRSIKRIVLPVDLTKESVQIVNFAAQLAESFAAEVHIVYRPNSDEWLTKKVTGNINYVKSLLTKKAIPHMVKSLNTKQSFANACMAYGEEAEADLFAVAHFSESILPQFDTFSQDMITNKHQIPVLIVNAEQIGGVKGQYSFLTV